MRNEEEESGPPSGRDTGAEDFLFHLYRGSELLQDNRVHEAKSELEQALARKPADPKSQDLLAVVYFRLGMYPRAIAIYEVLVRQHPGSVTPRVNLALCYVKTGQPNLARAELERVLETNPEHARAWGYLGLTYQRLGNLDKARHAFLSGGHESMARRIEELFAPRSPPGGEGLGAAPPAAPDSERTALGMAARDAATAVERDGLRGDPGASADDAPPLGTWAAHEPGRDSVPDRGPPSLGFQSMPPVGPHDLNGPATPRPNSMADGGRVHPGSIPPAVPTAFTPSYAPASLRPSWAPPSLPPGSLAWAPAGLPRAIAEPSPPADATAFARAALLVFPRDATTVLHPGGFVLMRAAEWLAARLDVVRAITCGASWQAAPLPRRSRGRSSIDEPLGGATPILEILGRTELALAPAAGQRLLPVTVSDEDPLTVREGALCAMEAGVRWECGRMAVGDGEAFALVQLRGSGAVVLSVPPALGSVEVEGGRAVLLRALSVVGWVGPLVPRVLLPSEAPTGARGLVAFAGEGMVLVDVR